MFAVISMAVFVFFGAGFVCLLTSISSGTTAGQQSPSMLNFLLNP